MSSATTVEVETPSPDERLANDSPSRSGPEPCAHCGLPLDPRRRIEDGDRQFCCPGCQIAYELITDSGLEAYYRLARDRFPVSQSSRQDSSRFEWFDQPRICERYVNKEPTGAAVLDLALQGVHCAACIWLLEKLPTLVPGVMDAHVRWASSTLRVRWDPQTTSLSQIAATLSRLGYEPYPVEPRTQRLNQVRENRKQLIRLAVAGALAGNNMLIALALYLGMFSGIAGPIEQLLRAAAALLGVLSLVWPGRIFLLGACNALRTRTPHMDLPVALGLSIGTLSSLVNAWRGSGDIYFDSISVLVFVLLLGRFIQSRQQRSATEAIELVRNLTPKWIRVWHAGDFVDAPLDCLQVEDRVHVAPGELIPADGLIEKGSTAVDESILSGESRPIEKRVGDLVLGGTQNLQEEIEVRVQATGAQSRIGRIAELVDRAAQHKPRIVAWTDRIGGRFVLGVLALATITFAAWLFYSPTQAVDRAVALLIVACPCALALATPLAVSVGFVRAARQRILIKSGDVFQSLATPGIIWLDKTGTLTLGQARVLRWFGDRSVIPPVAALQSRSRHPISRAFSRAQFNDWIAGSELPVVDSVAHSEWGGIRGKYQGQSLHLGNRSYMELHGIGIDRGLLDQAESMLSEGLSPVFVARNRRAVAVAGVGDPLRPDAQNLVSRLQDQGWTVGVLSGDHPSIVEQTARQLGIPIRLALGDISPEGKVQVVRESRSRLFEGQPNPTIVMIGDGVNDSAALAAADVGIAAHRSAETSLGSAPVYLADEGLDRICRLVDLSKATMATIRRNLLASFSYNVLAVSLAMAGWVTPLLAAILMPLSSITVVAISLVPARGARGRRAINPIPVDR